MPAERIVGANGLQDVLGDLVTSGCSVGVIGSVAPMAYRRFIREVHTIPSTQEELIGFVGEESVARTWVDKPENDVRSISTSLIRLDHDRRIGAVDTSQWSGRLRNSTVRTEPEQFLTSIESKLETFNNKNKIAPMMSIYPLGYLAGELGWDRVGEFVIDTSHQLRGMCGIGFYTVDRGVRNSEVESIIDLFDALVVLRSERDTHGEMQLKQKWHVNDYQLRSGKDIKSRWIPVDSTITE